ncbi:MAG: methenyltetrahydromethanopterin cyclohydrolase [Candidatus Bathyarchaeia archaeon]
MARSRILSVNREASKIIRKICESPEKYNVLVERGPLGAQIIDAGVNAGGGYLVGKLIAEICLGGLGETYLSTINIGGLEMPSITVYTDHPAISTLGSQMAGWRIKAGDYTAIGSGPARAIALKPKSIYERIGYRDEASEAILVLEASERPPESAVRTIAEACHVSPERVSIIITPTSSIAGLTQISGRAVEAGMYKLVELGFEPRAVLYAWGCAPIPPPHPDSVECMGRSNDAILYGGVAHYIVRHDDDNYLKSIACEAVSSASKDYGKPFSEIFREAGQDFYKVDPKIFAPASITITNEKTGKTFTAGKINVEVLLRSMGLI